jgi:hypothetical protein
MRSSLFTANDADGDSLLYFFYDNSAAARSGHFEVMPGDAAGTTFAVTQAELANTTFVAGTTDDDLSRERLGWRRLQRTQGVQRRRRVSIARTTRRAAER